MERLTGSCEDGIADLRYSELEGWPINGATRRFADPRVCENANPGDPLQHLVVPVARRCVQVPSSATVGNPGPGAHDCLGEIRVSTKDRVAGNAGRADDIFDFPPERLVIATSGCVRPS